MPINFPSFDENKNFDRFLVCWKRFITVPEDVHGEDGYPGFFDSSKEAGRETFAGTRLAEEVHVL